MFKHLSCAAAFLLAFAMPGLASAQTSGPPLHYACYVPEVGAVYRIKTADLPPDCLEPDHVEFSWPAAPASPPTLSLRSGESVYEALTPDVSYDFQLYCQPGEIAVGVALNRQLGDAQVETYASQPITNPDGRAGWELKVWYRSGGTPGLIFTAAVQCASVSVP